MRINRIERNITVILFFLVLVVFSIAQEKSRVIERAYSGKWKVNVTVPVKSPNTTMSGPVQQAPSKID
jgi:hypothetical protein